ncbi:MAG: type I pullulanase [Clostridiales bacterium]|nr:type I pullulanase [Clostridiales bacterium]
MINFESIRDTAVHAIASGIHQYKFKVGGDWVTDPFSNRAQGSENLFFPGDPNRDIDTVTVRVHYRRADREYENWNIYAWNSEKTGRYDFIACGEEAVSDIILPGRATRDISFKVRKSVGSILWAKEEAQVSVDLSVIVSGTVDVYVTAHSAAACIAFSDDVVYSNKIASIGYDYDRNAVIIETAAEVADSAAAFGITNTADPADDIAIIPVSASGRRYTFRLSKNPELKFLYRYKILFREQERFQDIYYDIRIDSVYASKKFEEKFTYLGDDLGVCRHKEATVFKVWAPTAEKVTVRLYRSGDPEADDLIGTAAMSNANSGNRGEWNAVVPGDLSGIYYTYEVSVGGKTVETIDPYARSAGVNGMRGMIIDLASTDPAGWEEDNNPNAVASYTDAIIYELHMRDFSMDESAGIREDWRGKFLAFTQSETTLKDGKAPACLDHIKKLGVTHLHLLPVYDYASVDEGGSDAYNWGYDPLNYNVPEGSYSTDPYRGEVRVREMKQMIRALHKSGISVVMDVVYNHVYDAETFCFNRIVPGYFSRLNSNASGCGNDTASERKMVRKYIVDSVLYWTKEYHIDGFRFDLVGLIDIETINRIVAEVHAIRPDVIFYGEGWNMDGTNREPGAEMAKQGNAAKTPGFAYFSDSMRNLLAGNNGRSRGFVSGGGNEGDLAANYIANPWWSANPAQVVQYVSCHDNYTLADKLILSTGKERIDADTVRMNRLAAAIYLTAQGIPFIHAGEEFLREKRDAGGGRCENSYNAPDDVNRIRWYDLMDPARAALADYYRGLIAFRRAHPALSLPGTAEIRAAVSNRHASDHLLIFWIDGSGVEAEAAEGIYLIFNAGTEEKTVFLPEGKWDVYVNGTKAGTEKITTAEGAVKAAGISAMVLLQEESFEKPEKKSDVALPGSFNGWNQTSFMAQGERENIAVRTLFLPAGEYEFKIKTGDRWLGNRSIINDTTGGSPWEMAACVQENCRLKASGGIYTFVFDVQTELLTLSHVSDNS